MTNHEDEHFWSRIKAFWNVSVKIPHYISLINFKYFVAGEKKKFNPHDQYARSVNNNELRLTRSSVSS